MEMKHLTASLLMGLSALAVSCAPVPPKHPRVPMSHAGVRAQLVDDRTGAPISKRSVRVGLNKESFSLATNSQGKLKIQAAKLQTGTAFTQADVSIDCQGYQHKQFHWVRPESRHTKTVEEAGVVSLGSIRLTKQ